MLNVIHAVQVKLAADGTSIDNVILLVIALFIIMSIGYLVECRNSEGE